MKMLAIHQINVIQVIVGVVSLHRMFVIYNWYYPRLLAVRRLVLQIVEMISCMIYDMIFGYKYGIGSQSRCNLWSIYVQSGDRTNRVHHDVLYPSHSWEEMGERVISNRWHIMCVPNEDMWICFERSMLACTVKQDIEQRQMHTYAMLSILYERGAERVCKGL